MTTDPERVKLLAFAQDEAITASRHLKKVNLRRCPAELRELIKELRDETDALSARLHEAIVLDAKARE